jgi:hypothetical protein
VLARGVTRGAQRVDREDHFLSWRRGSERRPGELEKVYITKVASDTINITSRNLTLFFIFFLYI